MNQIFSMVLLQILLKKYLDKNHADMMREFCKKNKLEY